MTETTEIKAFIADQARAVFKLNFADVTTAREVRSKIAKDFTDLRDQRMYLLNGEKGTYYFAIEATYQTLKEVYAKYPDKIQSVSANYFGDVTPARPVEKARVGEAAAAPAA